MSRVMLIAREDGMPPIGATGHVVGEYEGDLEVEFDNYPCPAGPGTDWLCDPRWLVLIDGESEKTRETAAHIQESVR